MYATGKGGGNCLKNASDGYLFVFDGGSPDWQEAGGQPTVETEILVLSLETELRLLMLSTTVHRVN